MSIWQARSFRGCHQWTRRTARLARSLRHQNSQGCGTRRRFKSRSEATDANDETTGIHSTRKYICSNDCIRVSFDAERETSQIVTRIRRWESCRPRRWRFPRRRLYGRQWWSGMQMNGAIYTRVPSMKSIVVQCATILVKRWRQIIQWILQNISL